MTDGPVRHETYTHGHAPATVRQHAQRTAEEAAAFVLPELRQGMRVLDVGCGPGSITRGLAERVAPGDVVGVDLSTDTLEAARRDAGARGLANLHYQEGSVYALPFPDASFDVAYAHQVLQHLREREAALSEMLRVLRPGGSGTSATRKGASISSRSRRRRSTLCTRTRSFSTFASAAINSSTSSSSPPTRKASAPLKSPAASTYADWPTRWSKW